MGTNMNLYVEWIPFKNADSFPNTNRNVIKFFAEVFIPRDYALYWSLSGYPSQGEASPLIARRGWPANLSKQVEKDRDIGICPSWLLPDEIKQALQYAKIEEAGSSFNVVLDLLTSIEKNFGKNKARLVFSFDQ